MILAGIFMFGYWIWFEFIWMRYLDFTPTHSGKTAFLRWATAILLETFLVAYFAFLVDPTGTRFYAFGLSLVAISINLSGLNVVLYSEKNQEMYEYEEI